MMDSYTAFAKVYDEFMDNIDYDAWGAFLVEKLRENDINDGFVLDLGCGTGTITSYLAEHGYDMTGVDGSSDMLQAALEQRDKTGADILYLCQDMREFELYGTMRAIVSTCDCINYILEDEELAHIFDLVHNYLDPNGIFIFDFTTTRKYEKIGEACIAETRENGSFIWENFYDEAEKINEYQLTLFIREEGDLYRKYEEYHEQKAYGADEIKEMLKNARFEIISENDDYTQRKATDDSERIVVTARCLK